MFGAIKKLFGKEEEDVKPSQVKATPAAPARPTGPGAPPQAAAAPAQPSTVPLGEQVTLAQPIPGESVEIPLKVVSAGFTGPLAGFSKNAAKGSIHLPKAFVISQLAKGALKLPFRDVRVVTPELGSDTNFDNLEVSIPLSEVVPRIPANVLSKNPQQRKVDMPKIGDLFGSRGEPLKPVDNEPASPGSASRPAAPAPVTPAAPKPSPISPKPAEAAEPKVFEAPTLVPQPKISVSLPLPGAAKPAAPAPIPAPSLAMPSTAGASADRISIPLNSLIEGWPVQIKQELSSSKAGSINIPADRLEAALKTGKAAFSYKEIRSWLKPVPLMDEVPNGDTVLDLPLNVVAPLFIARSKTTAAAPRKTVSGGDIPDIFGSAKTAAAPAEPAVAPAAPAAPARPAVPSIPAPAAIKPSSPLPTPGAPTIPAPGVPRPEPNVLGALFGDPARKEWPPADVVKKCSAFKGVSGAVIGSHDGLLIAGHVPDGLSSDAIAGLLAQVCGRLNQQAKELKLSDVTELNVVFGDTTWRIFRLKESYFIVIGKPKEELPGSQLRMIANELGKR